MDQKSKLTRVLFNWKIVFFLFSVFIANAEYAMLRS